MTDSFQFDEQSAFRSIQEQFRRITEAESSLSKTQANTAETVDQSRGQLQQMLGILSSQADGASQEAIAATNRLAEIQMNPRAVNKIMGLFDPEFNEGNLRARAGAANLELGNIDRQAKRASTLHRLNLEGAASNVKAAQQPVLNARQKLQSSTKLLELGIKVEDEVREEEIEAAQDMSVEQLIQIREGIKTGNVPEEFANFADKPGLIEATIQDKQLSSLGVDAASIQNARSTIALQADKTADQLKNFNVAELSQMIRTDTFPANVTGAVATEEVRRRNKQEVALAQSAQALQKGDIELSNLKKTEVLQASTLGELQSAFESASVAPTRQADVTRGGSSATFTIEELSKALQIKTEDQKNNINRVADMVTATAAGQTAAITNQIQIGNIARELAPGSTINPDNPLASLPTEAMTVLAENSARIQQLETMKASLPVGPATAILDEKLANEQLALQTKIEKVKTQIIERTPTKQKGATSEYLNNGAVSNLVNAGSLLAEVAINPEALNHNSVFKAAWRDVSNEFLDLSAVSSGSTIGVDDSGFVAVSQTGGEAQSNIFENALKATKFRDRTAEILLQQALSKAVANLSAQTRDPKSGDSPFDGIIDPSNGLLLPQYYKIDPETGARQFSKQILNIGLSKKSASLREEGFLKDGQRVQDFIYDEVTSITEDLNYADQTMRGNSTEASLAAFAFNNHPEVFVRKKLVGLQANVDAAEQAIGELEQQLKAEIKAITDVAQGDPNIGGLVPVGAVSPEDAPKTIFDILNR